MYPYGPRGPFYGGLGHAMPADVAALAQGFQGMNVHPAPFASKNAMVVPANGGFPGLYPGANHYLVPGAYGDGGQYTAPHGVGGTQHPGLFAPPVSQFVAPMGYPPYVAQDISPLSSNHWTPTTVNNGEVPTLITPRRDSVSSNENDQPTTPSYANYPGFVPANFNRSPSGLFAHGTPSPTSMMTPFGFGTAKQPEQSEVSPHIKMLVARDPAIPRAIPAPSSPLKPLDRALENQRGETNVYIRGLLPETTDEMLAAWAGRFGEINSSKSIIDLNTGLCKGFGFVKYFNYTDAENCIRGFHYLGYEVSFARESFYSKLKTFADENNTNLYISNLPKTMNEHELAQLFAPHKVASTRILRDKNGHGRGVGFARFESRDVCDEVIKKFGNHTLQSGDEELQIQIRFADTQEQKTLKQQTQAARQFRSAEYEYATQALRQGGLSLSSGQDGLGEFDQYLNTTAPTTIVGQRLAAFVPRTVTGRSPLSVGATAYAPPSLAGKSETAAGDDSKKSHDNSVAMKRTNSPEAPAPAAERI
ncbi:hypothetical protein K470DRAFT_282388 [Piedraia hortae CBS 480.64]|uniref:RRM domain-containing protein n=1 Tax=Piedraia hortae CBS 480.64 TaxID=1314780 RepID=A0A6A7BYV1_9PEZI|nr:hypothetical protein K470DRAFT_282388 [Piedraia hortae CBS 480.64]